MLEKLHITNYAIIDELEIIFSANLNIITGETGAGKSILLGAMGLILGERANLSILRDEKQKCVVEGWFNISSYDEKVTNFFKDNDLDYDETAIIRREITPSGKSRAFINDTPVSLSILKQLTEQLVNLLAQHQTLYLNDKQFQLDIIDTLSEQTDKVLAYKTAFKSYIDDKNRLKSLLTNAKNEAAELDYINFQIEEFEKLELNNLNEQTELEDELEQLSNVDAIKSALESAITILSEDNINVLEQLLKAKKKLGNIEGFHDDYKEFSERIESVVIELQDLDAEITLKKDVIENNPARLFEIQKRLDAVLRLQNKHQTNSIEGLLTIFKELAAKKDGIVNTDSSIEQLTEKINAKAIKLMVLANKLSKKRQTIIPKIEQKTDALLSSLGMENAKLKVVINNANELTTNGIDEIEWQFSANKGMPFVALKKVASGGELSRLMLSIQSILAGSMAMPTLIFDEIDTGISGEVAKKVGRALKDLAQKHQLICITHLPQIASCSEDHYFVYKVDDELQTKSNVKRLTTKEHIHEIAQMIDGKPPSGSALSAAQNLVKEMI